MTEDIYCTMKIEGKGNLVKLVEKAKKEAKKEFDKQIKGYDPAYKKSYEQIFKDTLDVEAIVKNDQIVGAEIKYRLPDFNDYKALKEEKKEKKAAGCTKGVSYDF